MDYALVVCGLQSFTDLPEDLCHAREGQASLAAHQRRQVLAVDVLHRQELHASGFAEVVDAQDVLVGDVAGELNLALETLQRGGILWQLP